jgi:hypothetical protein
MFKPGKSSITAYIILYTGSDDPPAAEVRLRWDTWSGWRACRVSQEAVAATPPEAERQQVSGATQVISYFSTRLRLPEHRWREQRMLQEAAHFKAPVHKRGTMHRCTMAPYDCVTPFPNRSICIKRFYEAGKELLRIGTPHGNNILTTYCSGPRSITCGHK